jgi:hypothetical protein
MTDYTTTAIEHRLRATYAAVAARTDCSLQDQTLAEPWRREPERPPRRGLIIGIAAACMVVLVALALTLVANGADSPGHVGTTPTSTPARLKWPGRIGLPLPDESLGFMAWKLLYPPTIAGPSSLEAVHAAWDKWVHTLSPVTRKRDPKSARIGFYLPNIGFIPKATVEAAGFNIDAVIARGPCADHHTALVFVSGDYQCAAIAADAQPLGTRPPPGVAPTNGDRTG